MKAEQRLHWAATTGTVVVMFVVAFNILDEFDTHTNQWSLGSLTAIGTYTALITLQLILFRNWRWLRQLLLHDSYLEGTWVGRLKTSSGNTSYIIEHIEQTLTTTQLRGRALNPCRDWETGATYYSESFTIDEERGLFFVVYLNNITKKHYPVEALGKMQIDRDRKGRARSFTGYAIDVDKGIEWLKERGSVMPVLLTHDAAYLSHPEHENQKEKRLKLQYDTVIRVSEKLLDTNEVLEVLRRCARAKVKSCVRTRSGGDPVLPDSIDESDVSDDVGQELVALEPAPVSLGRLAELEDHREHPGA